MLNITMMLVKTSIFLMTEIMLFLIAFLSLLILLFGKNMTIKLILLNINALITYFTIEMLKWSLI